METSFRSNFLATWASSPRRAMVPSSFIISTIAPAGFSPASLAKSMAASVWPVLRSTPPSFALSGKICPGLLKSKGFMEGSTNAFTVFALSLAEMPVVTPCPLRSMEIVKAVSIGSVLLPTIISSCNSLQRLSVMGVQIRPRPWVAIKLMISGVIFSAAATKSPSFSRSSSSTTIITLPCLISAIASSMVFNCILVPCFVVIIVLKFWMQR